MAEALGTCPGRAPRGCGTCCHASVLGHAPLRSLWAQTGALEDIMSVRWAMLMPHTCIVVPLKPGHALLNEPQLSTRFPPSVFWKSGHRPRTHDPPPQPGVGPSWGTHPAGTLSTWGSSGP